MYCETTSKRIRIGNIDDKTKQVIIAKLNQGYSGPKEAKITGLKTNTIRQIYWKYKKTNETKTGQKSLVTKKRYKPRKRKSLGCFRLTDEQNRQICEWVNYDCTIKLKQLKAIVLLKWPELVSINVSTIGKALKPFHYSFRRVSINWDCKNELLISEYRNLYAQNYIKLKQENKIIFFLDDYGLQIYFRESMEQVISNKEEKAPKINRSRIRGLNYSLYVGMSADSLYIQQIESQPYNTNNYLDFLKKFCDHLKTQDIEGAYLIMNKVDLQKIEDINRLIEQNGQNAIFLPPISSLLNPVESLFSQWRDIIRNKDPQNQEQLHYILLNAIELITSENLENYINNMEQYLYSINL